MTSSDRKRYLPTAKLVKLFSVAVLCVLGVLCGSNASRVHAAVEPHVLKFATLAPEGSTWMKVMNELNDELQKKTDGRVKFKMFAGGIQGDEKDVVRKVRIGQLQAAGFTGVGLGQIAPAVRILDAPWLFRSSAESDFVQKKFAKELDEAVLKGGYVNLGFTDLGSVYVFSKNKISSPDDMRRQKMWVWEGDPIAQAAYAALGVSPIPLSIVDVMSSLETGLIDAVYGPPMGVIALQWFTRTKYIYNVPIADSNGAVLVSKKAVDELSQADRKTLLELGAKYMKKLNELSRKENADALVSLQKQGLQLSEKPSQAQLEEYEALGRKARQSLVGKLYSQQLLDSVEKALAEFRAKPRAKPKAKPKKR